VSAINSVRRFFLLKTLYARQVGDDMEAVWRSKQEAHSGVPLPLDFPLKQRLAALGYTTREDLDGADVGELVRSNFSSIEAKQVIDAFAAL